MFDSLAYRNDAAIVMRRLIRSLPNRVRRARHRHLRQGTARDDARARRHKDLPGVIVPGGVTLPARGARRRRSGAEPGRPLLARTDQPRLRRRRWGVARADRRAAAASFSGPRRHRRWWPRRWASRCRTARSRRPANRSGSSSRGRSAAALRRLHAREITVGADPDQRGCRERDAGARRIRRIDESAAAHSGDCARRPG